MRRVIAVTGTRADLGLWQPVLREAERQATLEISLLVTGMHLDPAFGRTVDEIRAAGHRVAGEIPSSPTADDAAAMAAALGVAVQGMAPLLRERAPDWLAVLGDRGEQLAAAIVAAHLRIPVAHVHGGEVTRGAVDDAMRDAISRFAHVHLVATDDAAERLRRMGEEAWRIHRVGAPGLDGIGELARTEGAEDDDLSGLLGRYGLPSDGPYLLLLFHPETATAFDPDDAIAEVLAALEHAALPALAIAPNNDAGGRRIAAALRSSRHPVGVESNLRHADFVRLLSRAAALVGNSSSGIIEAPLLRVPAVNIGRRQEGRTRGDNVIEAPLERDGIARAIARAIDPAFRAGLSGRSPYGDGQASPRIVRLLASAPVDERLLLKRVAA